MKSYFVLFISSFLVVSSIFAAPSQITSSSIDGAVLKAMRDVEKSVDQGIFGGTVAIAQVHTNGEEMADDEVQYFAQMMETLLLDIRSKVSIRFASDAFKNLNDVQNREKMQARAEEMGTKYVAYITIEKEAAAFSLSMTVFETNSLKQVWNKSWKNFGTNKRQFSKKPSKISRYVGDMGLVTFLDEFYFFGASLSTTGEIADVFSIGVVYALLFTFPKNMSTTVYINNTGYNLKAEVFGIGYYGSILMAFSLINSHKRDFDLFDLEWQFELGYFFGSSTFTGTAIINSQLSIEGSISATVSRPVVLTALNFVFIDRIFLRIGVDYGRFRSLSSTSGSSGGFEGLRTSVESKTFIRPFLGFGYRFDPSRRKK